MEDAELSITVEDARKRIAEHQREGGGFQVRTRTVQYIYNEDLQEIRVGGEVFLTSPFRETNAWNQDGHDDDFIGVLQMHPGKLSQKERKAFDCAETVTKEILLRRNHIVKALNVRKTFLQRMLSIFRHSPVLTEQEKSSVLSQVQAAIMGIQRAREEFFAALYAKIVDPESDEVPANDLERMMNDIEAQRRLQISSLGVLEHAHALTAST